MAYHLPVVTFVVSLAVAGFAYAVASPAQRIEVTASKFVFSTGEIHVRKGRPVTLVLTATDFAHGFSLPDFNTRVDLVPGKAVELTFTPDHAGRFVFLCDNFCGEDHELMSGFLVVTEE